MNKIIENDNQDIEPKESLKEYFKKRREELYQQYPKNQNNPQTIFDKRESQFSEDEAIEQWRIERDDE